MDVETLTTFVAHYSKDVFILYMIFLVKHFFFLFVFFFYLSKEYVPSV